MAREIPLSRGSLVAIVDDEDFERLSRWRWCAVPTSGKRRAPYALRTERVGGRNRAILMHRLLLEAKPGQIVDHINGDTLDNRRANLRLCTPAQNSANMRPAKSSATGYRGVSAYKTSAGSLRYAARIRVQGRNVGGGFFGDPAEAARAYDRLARAHHGEFAVLNFPEPA